MNRQDEAIGRYSQVMAAFYQEQRIPPQRGLRAALREAQRRLGFELL
jgi:hypothetical protein